MLCRTWKNYIFSKNSCTYITVCLKRFAAFQQMIESELQLIQGLHIHVTNVVIVIRKCTWKSEQWSKENGQQDRTASPKALKMCTENIVYNIKIIFTIFGPNTDELHNNHIEFQNWGWNHITLNPRKTLFPPLDMRSPSHCSFIF